MAWLVQGALDQVRYAASFASSTVVLPAKPLRALAPIPLPPSLKDSHISSSDPGGAFCLVIGGTAGIGKELVYALALRGADVILGCRNLSKGETVKQELLLRAAKTPGAPVNLKIEVAQIDTADLDSVQTFATTIATLGKANVRRKHIRFLFLNAGITRLPQGEDEFTRDGLDKVYVTNFLSQFLLVHLLEKLFTEHSRIISTSSAGGLFSTLGSGIAAASEPRKREDGFHIGQNFVLLAKLLPIPPVRRFVYDKHMALYSQTKTMQMLFTRALAEHFERTKPGRAPFVGCFHPGLVSSDIFTPNGIKPTLLADPFNTLTSASLGISGITPEEGAATGLFLALAPRDKLSPPPASGVLQRASGAVRGASGPPGGSGHYWQRNACVLCPADRVDSSTVRRWWERFCKDAGIKWEL